MVFVLKLFKVCICNMLRNIEQSKDLQPQEQMFNKKKKNNEFVYLFFLCIWMIKMCLISYFTVF